MKIEIGDLVLHPDGDIGVVLDRMERYEEEAVDDTLYVIHWMQDGFLKMTRYDNLEVITDTFCPGDISSA